MNPLTALKLSDNQNTDCILRGAGASAALAYCADKLTPEQFDFCVYKSPLVALGFCAEKLTKKQKRYCVERKDD